MCFQWTGTASPRSHTQPSPSYTMTSALPYDMLPLNEPLCTHYDATALLVGPPSNPLSRNNPRMLNFIHPLISEQEQKERKWLRSGRKIDWKKDGSWANQSRSGSGWRSISEQEQKKRKCRSVSEVQQPYQLMHYLVPTEQRRDVNQWMERQEWKHTCSIKSVQSSQASQFSESHTPSRDCPHPEIVCEVVHRWGVSY